MSFNTGKSVKELHSTHIRTGVGMLLLLYVAVFLLPPGIIPHVHHDHDIHQDDSCQADACHIAIYHPGGEGRCEHKYHFTVAEDECTLCHLILTRQIQPPLVLSFDITSGHSVFNAGQEVDTPEEPSIHHADRGPPYQEMI